MKYTILVALAFLTGCASIPMSEKIGQSNIGEFYTRSADSNKVPVYFECRKALFSSPVMDNEMVLDKCQFQVNGIQYTGLTDKGVGRLDLPTGLNMIQAVPVDSSNLIVPLKLELSQGESAVVSMDFIFKQSPIGGALTASRTFTVDYSKENVREKTNKKYPVSMVKIN